LENNLKVQIGHSVYTYTECIKNPIEYLKTVEYLENIFEKNVLDKICRI